MNDYTATYSPDDNKLRLYSSTRLDPETYAQVKTAGFRWAPKQDLFVAPMWTPDREDLLIELAGQIDDEDKSLVERQEERAERFETYSENRAEDADRARAAVDAIADGIPMGQPILVGHHSERHARRDAAKIENGMRRAINLWETSKYWTSRAKGALRHAKYKERPDVRARRIKGIEADQRKQQRVIDRSEMLLTLWRDPCAKIRRKDGQPIELREAVIWIANRDGGSYKREHTRDSGYTGPISLWEAAGGTTRDEEPKPIATPEEIVAKAIENHEGFISYARRWVTHYENRLAYERAMLEEAGATDLLKPKPRSKAALLPILNYRQPGGIEVENRYHRGQTMFLPQIEMTAADYAKISHDYKATCVVTNSHRVRSCIHQSSLHTVFLTDSKAHQKPEPVTPAPPPEPPDPPAPRPTYESLHREERTPFDDMKQSLKAGVQIVTAPQLFPTPREIAERMVDLAQIEPGHRVLEPSAGTGALIQPLDGIHDLTVIAVEVNPTLADQLEARSLARTDVRTADFLECNPGDAVENPATQRRTIKELGTFDRIIMNPPFKDGIDIKHIKHAFEMLAPGGRLVALCANGPRQQEALKPLADQWETLESGSFAAQGTKVNIALLLLTKPENQHERDQPCQTTTNQTTPTANPNAVREPVQPRLF